MKDYTDTPRSAWERRKVAVLASMPAVVKAHVVPWQVIVIKTFAEAMKPMNSDHWIDGYMQANPETAQDLIKDLRKIDTRSVNVRQQLKVLFLRTAQRLEASGKTGRKADEIYTELCTLFRKELDQLGRQR